MSRDWEHDFTSIVKETESNLAKVRQRLDGSRYSSTTTTSSFSNNHPLSTYQAMPSVLSRSYIPSPSITRNGYSSLGDWRPRSGYQSQLAPGASSEGESVPSSSAESSTMVVMLTDKIDSQTKTIQTLSRQVDALERERDHSQTQLRRLDQEVSSLGQRLRGGGVVSPGKERKAEAWQREVALQLGDLQAQVAAQRRWGAPGDGSGLSDEVLNALTREVHDFKRQMQEDMAVCRREMDGLNTRLLRHEVDIGNNQANDKDLNRRMDHVDRALAGVSDSQRSQSRELNHTLHSRQTSDQEILQLRSEVSRLTSDVERLQNDVLPNSQRAADEPVNSLKTKSSYRNLPFALKAPSNLVTTSKDASRNKSRKARGPLNPTANASRRSLSESDDFDVSASLSLASSDDDDLSLDLPPHHARNVQTRSLLAARARDDDSSDAFSEMTSALLERDPTLDLVDLVSTPSISSVELDDDLL